MTKTYNQVRWWLYDGKIGFRDNFWENRRNSFKRITQQGEYKLDTVFIEVYDEWVNEFSFVSSWQYCYRLKLKLHFWEIFTRIIKNLAKVSKERQFKWYLVKWLDNWLNNSSGQIFTIFWSCLIGKTIGTVKINRRKNFPR